MSDLSREEKVKLARDCYEDPVQFCRVFQPHLYPKPIPWVHRGIWSILTRRTAFLQKYGELEKIQRNFVVERENQKPFHLFEWEGEGLKLRAGRYTLLMLPRGFSKTTLANTSVLRDIIYQDAKFYLYVSEASEHSTIQMGNNKKELENNERIRSVFGNLVPENSSTLKWTTDFCETTNGCAMIARGRGGQVRGLNWNGYRPDRVLVDDVEDLESVSTPEQLEKTKKWAYGDLLPVLPEMNEDARMTVLGTLLSPAALMTVFAADPQFTPVIFSVLDKDGELLWADNMDFAKIEAKKESYSLMGDLDLFYLEYFNTNRGMGGKQFRTDFFRFGRPPGEYRVSIYCDPAIDDKSRADKSVIYVVGMSERGQIVVLAQWSKRGASPREIVDMYFELAIRWKPSRHGFESNGYQAALGHLMREEMFRKKYYFEPLPINHTQKKTLRIKGILQPRFAAGYVYFACECNELRTQLLDFPKGAHDDHPDALAGAVELLDPFAAAAAGDEDLAKDEYPPLEEELGDWRVSL